MSEMSREGILSLRRDSGDEHVMRACDMALRTHEAEAELREVKAMLMPSGIKDLIQKRDEAQRALSAEKRNGDLLAEKLYEAKEEAARHLEHIQKIAGIDNPEIKHWGVEMAQDYLQQPHIASEPDPHDDDNYRLGLGQELQRSSREAFEREKASDRRIPICKHSGLPVDQCPMEEEWSERNEMEPTMENVGLRCQECGKVSFASREASPLGPHEALEALVTSAKNLNDSLGDNYAERCADTIRGSLAQSVPAIPQAVRELPSILETDGDMEWQVNNTEKANGYYSAASALRNALAAQEDA